MSETLLEVDGELMFGPPKTKNSRRTVPLPRRIVGQLEDHIDRYVIGGPDALIFTGPKGAPVRRAGFHRCWWEPAITAAGLPHLKIHELRHTFVALWVAAGANPKEVSVRAGHSSVAFTSTATGTSIRTPKTRSQTGSTSFRLQGSSATQRAKPVLGIHGSELNGG